METFHTILTGLILTCILGPLFLAGCLLVLRGLTPEEDE